MKEFMYATALCLLMLSGWSLSKVPGKDAIAAAADEQARAELEHERKQIFLISGGALVLALVCGVIGRRSNSREDASKKEID